MKVIILCAGLGSRLNSKQPKGFIKIKGQTLLDRIIKNFDPSKCLPIECIKSKHKSSRTSIDVPEDKYYVIDGRHRVIVFGILGITKIQTIVQNETLIKDYYRENNPILVDAETKI